MISLLGGIWENFVNGIREIEPTTRYIILGVLLFCVVACFALSINKGEKHDKEPIRWRYLIIAAVLILIMVMFGVLT